MVGHSIIEVSQLMGDTVKFLLLSLNIPSTQSALFYLHTILQEQVFLTSFLNAIHSLVFLICIKSL